MNFQSSHLFIPVISGGHELDKLLSVYLPLISDTALISYPYALGMQKKMPDIPGIFIDSGSFGLIKYGGDVKTSGDTTSVILNFKGSPLEVTPFKLLEFQEKFAFGGFTLDIPYSAKNRITPSECLEKSVQNAMWAVENRRKNIVLAASIPYIENYYDFISALDEVASEDFDMIALGGLVPYFKDRKTVLKAVETALERINGKPLHIFGAGSPDFVRLLFENGVYSTDSSSYIRYAVEGRLFGSETKIENPASLEMLHLALLNLAFVSGKALPLNFSAQFLKTVYGFR